MIWPQERSQEALDGLLLLARAALRSHAPERVPGVVAELIEALAAEAVSDFGSGAGGSVRLVDVSTEGAYVTPDEAGSVVGLSGRQVRNLCRDGHVRHSRVGVRGYLVDPGDLRRYLIERGAP